MKSHIDTVDEDAILTPTDANVLLRDSDGIWRPADQLQAEYNESDADDSD